MRVLGEGAGVPASPRPRPGSDGRDGWLSGARTGPGRVRITVLGRSGGGAAGYNALSVIVGSFGDIGCNTLLFFLDAIDTCTCMGGSDTERQGIVLSVKARARSYHCLAQTSPVYSRTVMQAIRISH